MVIADIKVRKAMDVIADSATATEMSSEETVKKLWGLGFTKRIRKPNPSDKQVGRGPTRPPRETRRPTETFDGWAGLVESAR